MKMDHNQFIEVFTVGNLKIYPGFVFPLVRRLKETFYLQYKVK